MREQLSWQSITLPWLGSRVRTSFPAPKCGALVKRLYSGLQIRIVQFDSETRLQLKFAQVVKLVDTRDLKSLGTYTSVSVRLRPRAPLNQQSMTAFFISKILFFLYFSNSSFFHFLIFLLLHYSDIFSLTCYTK